MPLVTATETRWRRPIFTKLGLCDDGSTHRRVLAVLACLESPPAVEGLHNPVEWHGLARIAAT